MEDKQGTRWGFLQGLGSVQLAQGSKKGGVFVAMGRNLGPDCGGGCMSLHMVK